jgi:hypothetical protein
MFEYKPGGNEAIQRIVEFCPASGENLYFIAHNGDKYDHKLLKYLMAL